MSALCGWYRVHVLITPSVVFSICRCLWFENPRGRTSNARRTGHGERLSHGGSDSGGGSKAQIGDAGDLPTFIRVWTHDNDRQMGEIGNKVVATHNYLDARGEIKIMGATQAD